MQISSTGPCCVCAGSPARVILHLPFEAPFGFQGWGCIACDLPLRGAVALICERCAGEAKANGQLPDLTHICAGFYLMQGKRVPMPPPADRVLFEHDRDQHPEMEDL